MSERTSALPPVWLKQHLASDRYQAAAKWTLRAANGHCEACKRRAELEIHLITTGAVGSETAEDLCALCKRCHRKAHHGQLPPAGFGCISPALAVLAAPPDGLKGWTSAMDAEHAEMLQRSEQTHRAPPMAGKEHDGKTQNRKLYELRPLEAWERAARRARALRWLAATNKLPED